MNARLKSHPAADLFPMMSEAELNDLAADIRQRGQLQPIIVTTGNLVLDGRNRLEACRRAEVEPYVLMWDQEDDPTASPTAYVLSLNLHRRHLTESQRAVVAADSLPMFEAEAKKRMKTAGRGAPRGAPADAQPEPAEKTRGEAKGKKKRPERASEAAAKATGASSRSVERAKRVLTARPDLREQLRAAKITLKQAEKTIRREEQIAEVKAYVPPVGEYGVITIDPPWSFDDKLDGSDRVRGGCPYPDMTIGEIAALDIPVSKDCAVFLWVTNAHLVDPDAYAVVVRAWRERYGLVPKQIRTWKKTKMGLGKVWRNITEHLVRLERGAPVFNPVTQTTEFEAPSGEHSEKPALAYSDIELLCAASSRLEMFARGERAGWAAFGSEQQAKSKKKRPDAVEPKPEPEVAWPVAMGGPHDWVQVNSVLVKCSQCDTRHSAKAKPRAGCPSTPAESIFDGMQRDQAKEAKRRAAKGAA